jgi:hypothetical protein
METQAQAPASAQAQTPVHPIHQEQQDLAAMTKFVQENPDNDPDHPTDTSTPRPKEGQEAPAEQADAPAEEVEQVEFDEETPVFEIEYKTDSGKEAKKLSLKELREGYLAKQDYHRNIQKVKQQEAQLAEQAKQAELKAQQEYLQRLETHKQLVLKTVAPELQNVDLNKLSLEDPAEAQRIFFKQIQLNQTIQNIEAEQRQAYEKFQGEQKAAFERAKMQSRQVLESDIPGWGEELYGKVLGSVAKDYGFKNEEVEPVVDARLIKVFHDAYQYRQLQRAKPEISKKVVAVPKVIKPGSAEKPSPAKEDTERSYDRLKKTGKGEDFVNWYLNKNKKGK